VALDARERTVEEIVAGHFNEEIEFLAELVRTPSDNPPGDCGAHAARTARLLEQLGFEVERHPVPEDLCRANGMISATNLIVRHRFGGDGPVIALNAHGDVVAPGDGWTTDPYGAEIKDGWMYGRGAAVSKSDFATYAFALLALRESSLPLAGAVELHFTYDEETGGTLGPKWLLEQGLSKPDLVISAGFSYSVVTAHSGCLHLAVEVRGKSAHAAHPDTGSDALAAATEALRAIYGLRDRLSEVHSGIDGIDCPSVTVGLIAGGINTNVVPDKVTFRLDRRIIPEESPDAAEANLRQLIEDAIGKFDGISVSIRRVMLAMPLAPLAGVERTVATLRRIATEVFGTEVGVNGVPIYTDARLYMAAGIPTVIYGAGPRSLLEANGHRADERLWIEDLRQATTVVARALVELMTA
jgi:acetylornithine deacetylase/succinyl-diaminopimelate desuccinylase family protein